MQSIHSEEINLHEMFSETAYFYRSEEYFWYYRQKNALVFNYFSLSVLSFDWISVNVNQKAVTSHLFFRCQ